METETKIVKLKRQAKEIGVQHSPNIGPEKLEAKIKLRLAELSQEEQNAPQTREHKIKEATKLKRVIVTCLNNSKTQSERQGEIFMVSNSVIGTIKKFVPYGHPFHVEAALLNVIRDRKFQQRTGRGKTEYIEVLEFAVQELPDLTPKEAEELKKVQALRAEASSHNL